MKYLIYLKAVVYYITVLVVITIISGLDSFDTPLKLIGAIVLLIICWIKTYYLIKLPSYNKENPNKPLNWEKDFLTINGYYLFNKNQKDPDNIC
jgi:hypothetical protein